MHEWKPSSPEYAGNRRPVRGVGSRPDGEVFCGAKTGSGEDGSIPVFIMVHTEYLEFP